MEIKPTTQITVSVVPDITLEFCSTHKKYIESLEYYELKEAAKNVAADKKKCEENYLNCCVTNTDDSVVAIIMFGSRFNNAVTTQRDYYTVASKAISRIGRGISDHYLDVFAWALTVVDEEALLRQIDDGISDVVWEYVDAYRRKAKEKDGKVQTGKKRGRKPRRNTESVVADSSSGDSSEAELLAADVRADDETDNAAQKVASPAETPAPAERKKPGPKPKVQSENAEAPKKRRGRSRKTAEAFEEEKVETYSEADVEAAKEAESIPVEGQPATAEIDFGF